jgi:hypothetical protein
MRLLAAGLVLVLLGGCLTHPAPAPGPAARPVPQAAVAPRALDWRAMGCQAMTWSVPVLASDLQPYLPEGFKPAPAQTSAGAALDQAAMLGFQAVECGSGLGQKTVLRSVQTGTLFTAVLPPADLREDRFAGHYEFGWDILVAPDTWRAKAAGWGLPIHDGGAELGPSAEGFTGAFAMDTVGTFTVSGRTVQGPAHLDDYESRTITRGAHGFAMWDASLENLTAATGVGVWDATPDSWVANLLGATQGAATFTLTRWDQPDAAVHWPGQALGPTEAPNGAAARPEHSLGAPSFDERPMGLL